MAMKNKCYPHLVTVLTNCFENEEGDDYTQDHRR